MKRIVLLLVGSLLTCWAAEAQLLGFGARLGIGTGSYEFDSIPIEGGTLESVGDRVGGYQAAIFMRLSIPTFIFIQPELQLSQRDYAFGIKYPAEAKKYENVRTYRLDVPLLLGFKFGAVRIFGGPVWRLGARQYARGGDIPLDVTFNDNDIATVGGAAVEFDGVFMELRYTGYLEETSSQVRVAGERKRVAVKHDGTVQVNFGILF